MSISISEEKDFQPHEVNPREHPLIEDEAYFVMVSHRELDHLIGQVMQMFELNGDVEQRNAQKQEFKWKARAWLDDIYAGSGYKNHQLAPKAKIVSIEALDSLITKE